MPPQSLTAASDEAMMNMIHNGGGHEDSQVDDHCSLQPEQEPLADTLEPPVLDTDAQKKRGLAYSNKKDKLL